MAALSQQLEAGRPWPLGAECTETGINFALFSAHAERVELCLLNDGKEERHELPACTNQVWHGFLPGAGPGLRYAYRVHGPNDAGHRFAPDRLLIDPYTRQLGGVFAYDQRQTGPALHSVAGTEDFDWGDDTPPATPWTDTVLYEIHVKGATRRHPGVPEPLRGTYAGLASPAMLAHYQDLGITALKLLPVHAFLDEERLVRSGLTNYWGYNTLAFFVPEPRYAGHRNGESPATEFRRMVRALHAAGIEVLLDVVFNHTAETDESGPTICYRGIDNASYYRLHPESPQRYENFSGCGNTFNLAHPRTLQLTLDALRYWVSEMHVDGFRFDLAAALTRDSAFLAALAQDPLLSRVKLIAEPWDLGPEGYRLGRFPPGWSEWNDRFRDDVRAFWLSRSVSVGALAQRLAGSSEIFRHTGRSPQAGINFITAHDGFTLRDLVSYAHKHNELNGEHNRDGNDHNHSINCGQEGETDDPVILDRRRRLQRALLVTLLTAQGVPMLQAGDELGRSQAGNNNAYCQDNTLTWLDWARADEAQLAFTQGLLARRQRLPQLARTNWLTGATQPRGGRDVRWWHPAGRELEQADWEAALDTLGMCLSPPPQGPAVTLCAIYHRGQEPVSVNLPPGRWTRVVASAAQHPFAEELCQGTVTVDACAVHLYLQPATT